MKKNEEYVEICGGRVTESLEEAKKNTKKGA